jgi:hypothetical protein
MALTQAAYRFGSDTGTNETDHGWLAAQNTAIHAGASQTLALNTVFLLRFGYQNNATAVSNQNFTVQYSINGGAWTTITTSSAAVDAEAATVLTNNGNTTNRLTGLTGTFQGATGQAEDGDAGGNSMDIVSNGCAEAVFSLKISSSGVSAGDIITFRSLAEGATITYSVTPTIYIAKTLTQDSTISSAAQLFAATVTVGAVTLLAPAIASTVDVRDSHEVSQGAAQELTMTSTISAGHTLYAPTIPTATVRLDEGATTRATRTLFLPHALGTVAWELTTDERNAITSWSSLRLTVIANTFQAEVSWAELQTPEAAAAQELTGATIATGSTARDGHTLTPGAVTLTGATIATGSQLYDSHTLAPGAVTLEPPAIAAGSTALDGHTVAAGVMTLEPPAIAATSEAYSGHSLTVGAVTLTGATIPAGSTVYDSHVVDNASGGAQNLAMPTIAAGSTVYDAHNLAVGAVTLEPPTVPAGSSVYDSHTVSPGAATLEPPAIGTAANLYAPVLAGLTLDLYEGATLRATRSVTLSGSLTTREYALTTDERNAIEVWSNLRAALTANGVQIEVSWLELETPEAAQAVTGATIGTAAQLYEPVVATTSADLYPPAIGTTTELYEPALGSNFLLVRIIEGATLRVAWEAPIASDYSTQTLTIDGDLDSVTDWSDLRVELISDNEVVSVAWLELETPEAAPLEAPTIAAGSQANDAHTVALASVTLTMPTISAGSTVYDSHTVTRGPLTLYPPLWVVGTQLYEPTVALPTITLGLPTIGAESAVQDSHAVAPGAVDLNSFAMVIGAPAVLPPSLTTGAVTLEPPTISTTEAFYAPVVAEVQDLVGQVITGSPTLYEPTVAAPTDTLEPPAIPEGSTPYAPIVTVSPVFLTGAKITLTVSLYEPSVTIASVRLTMPLPISTTVQLYEPSAVVSGVILELPTISTTVDLYLPIVGFTWTGETPTTRTYTPTAETRTYIPAAERRTWVAT